jgi:hypothetical protein
MSEQKTTQAGRRGFLKLVTTGLPVRSRSLRQRERKR